MTEPISSAAATVAGASVGAVAIVQAALGIDPGAVLWGLAGGMAALSTGESIGWLRALIAVSAAAAVGGGLAEILAWGAQMMMAGAPPRAVLNATAFLLGIGSQGIIRALMEKLPAIITGAMGRVFNRGGSNE